LSNKIKDEKSDVTTSTGEIQRIIREYLKNLYSNKSENLEEMGKFLDIYDQQKLDKDDIKHLNRLQTTK
jgi:hypothetical protein